MFETFWNLFGICWEHGGACWEHLTLDDPEPFGRYLGCDQVAVKLSAEESMKRLEQVLNGEVIWVIRIIQP